MEPLNIYCTEFLAKGWYRLVEALGIDVIEQEDGVSGYVRKNKKEIPITFIPFSAIYTDSVVCYEFELALGGPNQYRCEVAAIRDNDIITQLAKSLIASGAKVTPNLPWVTDAWGLLGFYRKACVEDWNRVLAGRASFVVEEMVNPSGALALPQGRVEGGPVPIRFGTGPAYTLDQRELSFYLEIKLHGRAWREPRVKEFMTELIARLKECGACPVVLWGQTQPCANAR